MYIKRFYFKKAIPVWEKGEELTMNKAIELYCTVSSGKASATVSASTVYTLFVNGELVSFGPARTAHGYYRVDEIPLDKYLTEKENEVLIRVCGYNANSYAYLDQASFVCAEVAVNDEIVAYTCDKCAGFKAYPYVSKMVKTPKYSFQRTFCEGYYMGGKPCAEPITLSATEPKAFIYRELPYGDYERMSALKVIARGSVTYSDKTEYFDGRFIKDIDNVKIKGYTETELEYASHIEYGKIDFSKASVCSEKADVIAISENCYADIAFEANRAGLIELDVEAVQDGTLFVTFDERYLENGPEPITHGRCEIIPLVMKKGEYHLVTAEPYVFKYMRLIAKDTAVTVRGLKQISVSYPKSKIKSEFISDDKQMHLIYDSAINTFRDNTVDIFMDCPSRERAGWLCDSFFTARVEHLLTGKSDVEKAFLYNFLYHEKDKYLPDGMLPMCYPSDHYNGNYIPNWAMWYVIELEEYVKRSGDTAILADAKDRMYALLDYFKKYENSDGLLEKLQGWIFIDWSEANKLVQDVSYATNMMYAYCLETIGKMYGDGALIAKAEKIRVVVRDQSMTGSGFFCDNAVRDENGELKLSGKCTEACQYYAFFTGVATPELYPELWNKLVKEFGFDRVEKGLYPEIYPANAFIANYIRLEILCRYGENETLYENIKGYFTYMAERTGTLWENNHDRASLNHGFASHVIYWMEKLGLVK